MYFLKNTHLKHGERKLSMYYLSHSGANVPGSESSTYGTFALGSESTWERKFQLPLYMVHRHTTATLLRCNERDIP